VLHDSMAITGLGRGLTTGCRLDAGAAAATVGVLRQFARIIAEHECAGVAAVGTQCLREADDGAAFVAVVREDTGLPLEIITGQEEARLTYLGACSELPADLAGARLAAFDVGGRSTEFGFGRADHCDQGVSLALGVLGLTEHHLTAERPTPAAVAAARTAVAGQLQDLPVRDDPPVLVGIGGTPATLGAVQLARPIADVASIHGHRLARTEVYRQIELYRQSSLAQRRQLPGLHPDRAPVILAGAIIVAAAMTRLGCEHLRVSVHGLRQGLLRDRFEEQGS
jgi:exopolyphosphatase/guanosine-5'-triphosphate,3'-diphosphate pyrophosphatase